MRPIKQACALLAMAISTACVVTAPQKAPTKPLAWEIIKGGVDLVVRDRARDALFVRARGTVEAIAPKAPDGRVPQLSAPTMSHVPAGSIAELTVAGSLRWLPPGGRWMTGSPAVSAFPHAPVALPPFAAISGVVVETPLAGPLAGLPRPLVVTGESERAEGSPDVFGGTATSANPLVPDGALVDGRDGVVLAVFDGCAFAMDASIDEILELRVAEARALPVPPAVGPGGVESAFAIEAPGRTGGGRFGVALARGGKVIAVVPMSRPPAALHLAAGALFAEVVEEGDRRLYRYPRPDWPTPAPSAREAALLAHRRGLLVGLREALDAGDLAAAVDRLELLQRDGLFDKPSSEESALATDVRTAARKALVLASAAASAQGLSELAWSIDRRARLLTGSGVLQVEQRPASLRLALAADPETGVSDAQIDALFEANPLFRKVEVCQPGSASACVAIRLVADPRDGVAEVAHAEVKLRAVAKEDLRKRAECIDPGRILLDDRVTGPAAVFSCDLDNGALTPARAFVDLVAVRGHFSAAPWRVATATLDGGALARVDLEPSTDVPAVLSEAVDAVLALQGERDLVVARSQDGNKDAANRALRSLPWRGPSADDAVRATIRGDGTLRTTLFSGPPRAASTEE